MEYEQKRQIALQTRVRLENHTKILNDYSELMNSIACDHEEKLSQMLVSINGDTADYWLDLFKKARKQQYYCHELTSKIGKLLSNLQTDNQVQDLSPQYLQLTNSDVMEQQSCHFPNWMQTIKAGYKSIFEDHVDYSIKRDFLNNLANLLRSINEFALSYLNHLSQVDNFAYFKNTDKNVVIIGANGSGKSSFSRNTKGILGGNVVIISAQKIFQCNQITNIPIGDSMIQNVHNFQTNDKLGKNWGNSNEYTQDLQNLMLSLIAEHSKQANEYFSNARNGQVERKSTTLERVMDVWKEIIVHRSMKYEGVSIKILTHGNEIYDFPQLSDGEKAVFYYIAHILLAKNNSFIIVDEPENHLHMAVVSRLWDKLEKIRHDCRFIYLTHNLDFASSRTRALKLWNRKFIPPSNWDIMELSFDENLPEALLMEILGSRQKIIFCEGEKSSPDYRLYSILFPNYCVKPVGGHLNVINYTRAFNKSKEHFGNTSIGIIDGDFHSSSARSKLAEDGVFCIEVQEIENLLCDELLIEAGIKRFCSAGVTLENLKRVLIEEIARKKDEQSIEYTTQFVNNRLKDNLLEKTKTLDALKDNFNTTVQSINIVELASERRKLFDRIIQENDFAAGIKYFNSKGLVAIVGNKIVNDYKNRILSLLEDDHILIEKLRTKYFDSIPVK